MVITSYSYSLNQSNKPQATAKMHSLRAVYTAVAEVLVKFFVWYTQRSIVIGYNGLQYL